MYGIGLSESLRIILLFEMNKEKSREYTRILKLST